MIELILIYQIFLALIIFIGFWLGFWVLFADRKAKSSQIFFLITILIILWPILILIGEIIL